MKDYLELEIPNGYLITHEEKTVDIFTAEIWLSTKRQHRYTSAIRRGKNVTLAKHLLVCPHCRHKTPAYTRFLAPDAFIPNRLPRNVISEWASPQMSLFEDEGDLILLNTVHVPDKFNCPYCGLPSSSTQGTQTVQLQKTTEDISLSCRTFGIRSLLAFPCVSDIKNITLVLPLQETVIFNFLTGQVVLHVAGANGHLITEQDISSTPDIWSTTTAYQLILKNTLVRRKLMQFFSSLWSTPLPFSAAELSPDAFVSMTLFQGYPSSFYDAIPYSTQTRTLDESFSPVASKLRNINLLPILYDTSGLPAMKSIRKLFFSNPGFFFYLPEATAIWAAFEDPNVFRTLFRLPEIYDILSTLHHYPASIHFFHDYYTEKGPKALVHLFQNDWQTLQTYSLRYAAMSHFARRNERRIWCRHNIPSQQAPSHSTPMHTDTRITACTINGYRFAWLRTRNDYQNAAKELNNCLNEWTTHDNPVIGVTHGGSLCAVIEVNDNIIRQAYAHDNMPIAECNPKLFNAYQKWVQKFSLHPTYFLSEYDDLDAEIEF